MPLGNLVLKKSCLFYLSPYVSNIKVDIQHALLSLKKAKEQIENFKSTAENTGSTTHTVQHWMTRLLNTLDNLMEVADT